MAGIHQFSSSKYIHSGSVAHFKSGVTVVGSVELLGAIYAGNYEGMSDVDDEEEVADALEVGNAIGDGTFEEWVTTIGEQVRITASGDFNGFCFIENQTLAAVGATSTWRTVSIGPASGLVNQSYFTRTYDEVGIYEHLIIAHNTSSLKTSTNMIKICIVENINNLICDLC